VDFNVIPYIPQTPDAQLLVFAKHFTTLLEFDNERTATENKKHLVWPSTSFEFDTLDSQFQHCSPRGVAFRLGFKLRHQNFRL
jgi:hypothetical protein